MPTLSIRTKLIGTLVLALTILLALGYFAGRAYRSAVEGNIVSSESSSRAQVTALRAQVHFKKQVQEWKNVLLRGHSADDFGKYLHQFYREENATRRSVLELLQLLDQGSESYRIAGRFLRSHERLGIEYRSGLTYYRQALDSGQGDPRTETDRRVRGIDREPTDLLDQVVQLVDEGKQRSLIAVNEDLRRTELQFAAASFLVAMVILTLITYSLTRTVTRPIRSAIEVARRISKGKYSGEIEITTQGEAADLLQALKTMQSNLAANRAELAGQTQSLRKARDAALAAAQAKSSFLANMSHELRTPMNGMLGMLELLQQTSLNREQKEYVDIAHGSGDVLLALINDLLDFSRLGAGKVTLESIDFDLRTLVEASSTSLAARAHEKGLELIHSIEADVPEQVKGDPTRLRQVLNNLIGNAIKFTDEGEVIVRVKAMDYGSDDVICKLRFEVEDSGIGISAQAQSRIFDSFTQADSTTTRKYGGTGLGLAISRELVDLMEGRIGVESSEGQGSLFWFTVSLASARESLPSFHPRTELKGVKVLIVDENRVNRRMLRDMTDHWGIESETAETAEEALLKLREAADAFSVAIFDMHLPDMSGFDLARRIRSAVGASEELKLVMLTSQGRRGDAQAAGQAGIEAYLTKPVTMKALHDCLSQAIGLEGTGQRHLITRHSLAEQEMRRRERILLVEDNPVNQRVALRMLQKLGYQADVSPNGLDAVRAVEERSFDLILMDVQMPVLDGFEATAKIRAIDQGRRLRTPIIAMTANVMKGDRARCLEAGMDGYLPKPVRHKELAGVLESWLGGRREAVRSA